MKEINIVNKDANNISYTNSADLQKNINTDNNNVSNVKLDTKENNYNTTAVSNTNKLYNNNLNNVYSNKLKKLASNFNHNNNINFCAKFASVWERVINIVLISSLLTVIFLQFNVNINNQMNSVIKNFNSFDTYKNMHSFYDQSKISIYYENLLASIVKSKFTIFDKYHVISPIRITQKRFKYIDKPHRLYYIEDSYKKNYEFYNSNLSKESTDSNNKIKLNNNFNLYKNHNIDPFMNNTLEEDTSNLNKIYAYNYEESFMKNGGYIIKVKKSEFIQLNNTYIFNSPNEEFLKSIDLRNKKKGLKYNNNKIYNPSLSNSNDLVNKLNEYLSQFKSNYYNMETNTATLVFDYVVFNYELNYFLPVYIVFYIKPSGSIKSEIYTNYIKLSMYSSRLDIFRLIIEILFTISIILYIVLTIYDIKITCNKKYTEITNIIKINLHKKIEAEILKSNNNPLKAFMTIINNKNNKLLKKSKTFLNRNKTKTYYDYIGNLDFDELNLQQENVQEFINKKEIIYKHEKTKYFPNMFSLFFKYVLKDFLLRIGIIVICFILFLTWIIFVISHVKFINNIKYNALSNNEDTNNDIYTNRNNSNNYNSNLNLVYQSFNPYDVNRLEYSLNDDNIYSLYNLTYILDIYKIIVCLTFLALFGRLIIFFKRNVVKKSIIFFNTLYFSILDLVSFISIFIIFVIGISLTCYIYFNRILDLNSFSKVFQLLFSYIVNSVNNNVYNDMFNYNKYLTIILMLIILILMKFILLKIVLAILIYWYNYSANLYDLQYSEFKYANKSTKEIESKVPKAFLFRLSKFFIKLSENFYDIMTCKKKDGFLVNKSNLSNIYRSYVTTIIPKISVLKFSICTKLRKRTSQRRYLHDYIDVANSKEFIRYVPTIFKIKQPILNIKNTKNKNSFNNDLDIHNKKTNYEQDIDRQENSYIDKFNNNNNLSIKGNCDSNAILNSENNRIKNCEDYKSKYNRNSSISNDVNNSSNRFNKEEINNVDCDSDIIEFNKSIKSYNSIAIRDVYFDSDKDKILIKNYFENYYKNNLLFLIIYCSFLISIIVSSFYFFITPYRYYYKGSFERIIDKYPENDYLKFSNIRNNHDIVKFLYNTIPSYFEYNNGRYIILNNNILVKNNIIVSVKRNILKDEYKKPYLNYIGEDNPYSIRDYEDELNSKYNHYENKTVISLNNTHNIHYSYNTSYDNQGGYVDLINIYDRLNNMEEYYNNKIIGYLKHYNKNITYLDEYYFSKEKEKEYKNFNMTKFLINKINYNKDKTGIYDGPYNFYFKENTLSSKLIDKFITQVAVELLLINFQTNLFVPIVITFNIEKGYIIDKSINTEVLRITYDSFEIIYIIFDILFIIFVIIFTIIVVKKINFKIKEYIGWHYDNIKPLSKNSQVLRQKINIEFFRKMAYVFDTIVLLDILSLICSYVYIIYKIIFLVKKNNLQNLLYDISRTASLNSSKSNAFLNNNLLSESVNVFNKNNLFDTIDDNYSIYYYKNEVDYIQKVFNYCMIISSIQILLMSFRFLFIIDLGKYFKLIYKTLTEAGDMLFIFFIILMLLQPSFVCFSYIAFGYNLETHSTWISSFLYTLIALFGTYEYDEFENTNSSLAKIHFYLYLIIINIIVINLFVATLDRSYNIVKEKLKNVSEQYNFKYVFLFCFYKRKKNQINAVLEKEDLDHNDKKNNERNNYNVKMNKLDYQYDRSSLKDPNELNVYGIFNSNLSYTSFSQIELANLKELDDEISSEEIKWNTIESSYLANILGTYKKLIIGSLYKNVNHNHFILSGAIYISYLSKVINNIEKNLCLLEFNVKHCRNYKIYKNYKHMSKIINDNNRSALLQVEKLENRICAEIETLEKYKLLNKKIDNFNDKFDANNIENSKVCKDSQISITSGNKNSNSIYSSSSISSEDQEYQDNSSQNSLSN